jgi:hypothetical protein
MSSDGCNGYLACGTAKEKSRRAELILEPHALSRTETGQMLLVPCSDADLATANQHETHSTRGHCVLYYEGVRRSTPTLDCGENFSWLGLSIISELRM